VYLLQVDEIKDIATGSIDKPFAANGHGDHVGTAGDQTLLHQFQSAVLAGSHNQAGLERVATENQRPVGRTLHHGASLSVELSATAGERDDFEFTVGVKCGLSPGLPGNHAAVEFHRAVPGLHLQQAEQIGDGEAVGDLSLFTINTDGDHRLTVRRLLRRRWHHRTFCGKFQPGP